jgi:Carboxypeptidase regulatory-like domain
MRGVRGGLTVLGAIAALALAQRPAPPMRDGIITGQIVDAATGKPVNGVLVALTPQPQRVLTAADGRFVFTDLPPGPYTIVAARRGYVEGASGRRRPGGTSQPVTLSVVERSAAVVVRMWKTAVITGVVTDESGDPVVGAQLRALERSTVAGQSRFTAAGAPAFTDDRGVYRFSDLAPGEYLVATIAPRPAMTRAVYRTIATEPRGGNVLTVAIPDPAKALQIGGVLYGLGRGAVTPPPPRADRVRMYPPTFYSSAPSPGDAAIVVARSGAERAGVDVQLQPANTVRVAGTLIGPLGAAPTTTVELLPAGFEMLAVDDAALSAVTDDFGRFVFPAVPEGEYTLRASARVGTGAPSTQSTQFAAMPISASAESVDVTALLQPGVTVSGRFDFIGRGRKPANRAGSPVVLEPADGDPVPIPSMRSTSTDTTFTVSGVPPGRYLVRATASAAGWMFRSAMFGGVDVSETPTEVTQDTVGVTINFIDRWSGLSGVARAADGLGDPAAAVLLFPANASGWKDYGSNPRRLRSTRTSARGEFGIASVPPGEYYVVAIPESQSRDWSQPARLNGLASLGTHITILEGEHRTVDLQTHDIRQ